MSKTNVAHLHHGGGDCPPFPMTHEDLFDPQLKGEMTAGFGSKPNYGFSPNVDGYLYDQPEIPKTQPWPSMVECAKGAGYVALSRHIEIGDPRPKGLHNGFRFKKDSRQTDMWRWFLENRSRIAPDMCLTTNFIPMCIELDCIYFRNNCAIPGLTADLIEYYTEETLIEGLDFSKTGCVREMNIPAAIAWNGECNRMLALRLVTVPPENLEQCKPGCGLLDGANFEVSARVFCPWAGE